MDTQETPIHFTVCMSNTDTKTQEVCKICRALADVKAAEVGCLWGIDESREDYLYPAERFMILELPSAERERFLAALEAHAAEPSPCT